MFSDDTFLARWLSGELTDKEKQDFEQDPEHQSYVTLIKDIGALRAPNFNEVKVFKELRSRLSTPQEAKTTIIYWGWLRAIAAVVVLGLSVWSLYPIKEVNVTTGVAENKKLVLPDGSQVSMQGGSALYYAPKLWKKDRTLDLRGEAFFQVKPGRTFTVKSRGGQIEVVGTSFNVVAIGDALAVQCFSGKVRVTDASTQNRQYLLQPGDFVQLHAAENRPLYSKSTNLPKIEQGQCNFYVASLEEVFAKMEAQFNVSIANKEKYQSRRFTGAFRNDNLELALKMVCIPMELRYSLENQLVKIEDK